MPKSMYRKGNTKGMSGIRSKRKPYRGTVKKINPNAKRVSPRRRKTTKRVNTTMRKRYIL